jgi:hypothetical protein
VFAPRARVLARGPCSSYVMAVLVARIIIDACCCGCVLVPCRKRPTRTRSCRTR